MKLSRLWRKNPNTTTAAPVEDHVPVKHPKMSDAEVAYLYAHGRPMPSLPELTPGDAAALARALRSRVFYR